MKTAAQIEQARAVLRERVLTPGLSPGQAGLLSGMLNALVWVADGPTASTMERVLAGEAIATEKDDAQAMETLDKLREHAERGFKCPRCGRLMAHSRLRGLFCLSCR